MRVLVGGIGYRFLCDFSAGVMVTDHLALRDWPAGVSVEDLSYGPIAVVQRFQDQPPEERFDRAILVSAVGREGRTPGTVFPYRWDGVLPSAEEVHRAVCDAVTGIILLDNTLIVAQHFGVLPEEVAVVEVEPLLHHYGEHFSVPVAEVFERMCDLVARMAVDPSAAEALPVEPLGGGAPVRLELP